MTVECPCGRKYDHDDRLIGRRLRCSCGRILTLGSSAAYEPPTVGGGVPKTILGPKRSSWKVAGVLVGILCLTVLVVLASVDSTAPSGSSQQIGDRQSSPTQASLLSCADSTYMRPATGEELGGLQSRGYGELTIDNGTSSDAVALLIDAVSGESYRAMYVREKDTGTIQEIAAGDYYLQFQFGKVWLRSRKFCETYGTSKFVDVFEFEEIPERDGLLYSTFQVTLHDVVGGTARTEDVMASEFVLPLQ